MNFDRLEEKGLQGFSAGALSFSLLTATAVIGGAPYSYLQAVGMALFAGLSILGVVVGLGNAPENK